MRRLIIRRIANLHFKYIATTQKVAGSTLLAVLILRFSPICPSRSANGLALTLRSPLARLSVLAAERPGRSERDPVTRWQAMGESRCSMLTATYCEPLISLEPKVGDPQACGVVAHHAFDILRETFGRLSVDVERQCQLGAANAIQLAED